MCFLLTCGWGKVGVRRVVGPERWGPEGWGPVDRPKFRAFFSLSRHKIRSFLPSLGVFSWWSGPRRPGLVGPPGFHTTVREPKQTCTFEGPGLQKHHQNSTRRHPEREGKNEFCGGRGKKRAKFWAVQGRAVPGRAVPGRAVPGRAVPGRAVPGHDQTKTLKPPQGNRETNTHKHTQKHTHT